MYVVLPGKIFTTLPAYGARFEIAKEVRKNLRKRKTFLEKSGSRGSRFVKNIRKWCSLSPATAPFHVCAKSCNCHFVFVLVTG